MSAFAGPTYSWMGNATTGRTHAVTKAISQTGLVLNLDAGVSTSYPGSGSTWTDLSGNGGSGTLFNSPTYSSANGGSLILNGTNQYVEVANYSALNGLNQTMICWAKSDSAANFGGNGGLMSKRDVYIMYCFATNTLIDYYYVINGAYQFIRITASNINNWNMYASSWDGSTIRAYFNGSLVSSSNFTGTLATSDTGVLSIGRDDGGVSGGPMKGSIATVQQYNRALSDTEISRHYTIMRGRFGV